MLSVITESSILEKTKKGEGLNNEEMEFLTNSVKDKKEEQKKVRTHRDRTPDDELYDM